MLTPLRVRKRLVVASLAWVVTHWVAPAASAAEPFGLQAAPSADPRDEPIPIRSDVVMRACATCHATDDPSVLSRISYRRSTPEGWQQTIRRMVSLNDLVIDAEEAREVVRYLSNDLGLAPEELREGRFEVERRLIDYEYTADKDTETTCIQCHSMGRVITQRRTEEEWRLLLDMHRGYYPLVYFQAFRRTGPPETEPGPDGRPPDNRHPMDRAIAHLSQAFPLHTPEWAAWSATRRPPRLEGRWALSGWERGKGALYGMVEMAADPSAADQFTTTARYTYATAGETVSRAGSAIVYTGYQWRGRSTEGGDEATGLREVMHVERDWRRMSGRWFSGGYDEIGPDITLTRVGEDPLVLGVDPPAVRASTSTSVRIYGANLPGTLEVAAVDLGPGVEVVRVVEAREDVATIEIRVDADAGVGARDVFLAGAAGQSGLVVYDTIDALEVSPAWGMARVGGIVFPKGYQSFDAIGLQRGPDGEPGTADDVRLGLVDVEWSLEEYSATYNDEDLRFVGSIDQNGLFTPAVDGPNPDRVGNRNNVGDVWVVATYRGDDAAGPLRARAHLLVSVPLYMRWEPWSLGQ